ncbi:MAG: hypothetical protein JXA68_09510 [Ignavibacteriales bacterium]|nr:hypothetical protein [Ignavibacteriales bacterium]
MKTYILTLKQKSGLLTELQSDTIYGHFCWRLKEQFGVEKLTEFIALYRKNQPIFILSDGLLLVGNEIHFPRPFVFNKPEIKQTKSEKILEFVKRKSSKERNFINLSELNKFLSSGKVDLEEKSSIDSSVKPQVKKPVKTETLRVSVQIDRNNFGSSEGGLFSYNPKYTREDVSYVIFIKVLDENRFDLFKCENILKELFRLGYGKKKSSGYGQFEVGDIVEFNEFEKLSDPNAFMILGNYLPSEDDKALPIGYDINTKYGKLGEDLSQSENPFKNPIVFLTAGSCFRTTTKKDFYGRVTEPDEISKANSFAVQFGIPFILNLNIAL